MRVIWLKRKGESSLGEFYCFSHFQKLINALGQTFLYVFGVV